MEWVDHWKYASVEYGLQYVAASGLEIMHQLHVDTLES